MKVTIDIPEEFVSHYNDDKFGDSLQRLKSDVHLVAGNYEKELVDMLIKAFKDANEDDTPKLLTPPHPRWIPKESEFYYYISDTSGVHIDRWNSDNIDEFRFNTGNVFRRDNVFQSSAEAEFAIERMKVFAEMREWAGKWNDGFVLVYIGNLGVVSFSDVFMYGNSFGEMRFATEKDAENCIKAVGADRIKKYYFMIPEGKEE